MTKLFTLFFYIILLNTYSAGNVRAIEDTNNDYYQILSILSANVSKEDYPIEDKVKLREINKRSISKNGAGISIDSLDLMEAKCHSKQKLIEEWSLKLLNSKAENKKLEEILREYSNNSWGSVQQIIKRNNYNTKVMTIDLLWGIIPIAGMITVFVDFMLTKQIFPRIGKQINSKNNLSLKTNLEKRFKYIRGGIDTGIFAISGMIGAVYVLSIAKEK